MKSRKEMGPSRAMRRRRRSDSVTNVSLYFPTAMEGSRVGRRRALGLAIAVALLLAAACASHREPPLPTIEDFSFRDSASTERFLEDWKSGAKDPGFYGEGFA